MLVDDTSTGRVHVVGRRPVVRYDLARADARRIVVAIADLCRLLIAAGATEIHLPFAEREPVRSADDAAALRDAEIEPSRMAISTVHLMGTARMGVDATRAVCDPAGRVFDTAGLRVADASLFPTPLGLNPQETVMALATLVAQHLVLAGKR